MADGKPGNMPACPWRNELDAILLFPHQNDWTAWLAANHAISPGVWLRLAKKGSPIKPLSYGEALEEALCYGWIDAQKKPESEHAWLQRFTPRRPKSIWSKVNREKATALIEAGRMQPPGLEQVERAKHPDCQEVRDPRAAHPAVRRDAGAPREGASGLNHHIDSNPTHRQATYPSGIASTHRTCLGKNPERIATAQATPAVTQ